MQSPKVEVFALCNYATFSKSGGLSVIDIFDEVYASTLPTTFARCAIALVIATQKAKAPLFLNLTIVDPQGVEIVTKDVQMVTGNNGKGNFIMDIVGLELEQLGEYNISVSAGSAILSEINFRVMSNKKKSASKHSKKVLN